MWPGPLAKAASHPFRETVAGEGDVSMLFMFVHFVVERWREALLWSWTVGKHGSLEDEWSEETMRAAWRELGGDEDQRQFETQAGMRDSVSDRRMKAYLHASGHVKADNTQYRFCE